MKQPILVILLLVLAFLSGYEIHRRRATVVLPGDPAYVYDTRQKAGSTSNSVANAVNGADRQAQIRQQELKIAALDKKVQAKAAAMAEYDQRLNAMDKPPDPEIPANTLDAQVSQTQAKIQNLLNQKQQQGEQTQGQAVAYQIQSRTRKLEQEQDLQRFREQLQKEMASANALNRQVQELMFIDDDLATLETLKPQAQAQQDRVNRLQAQYQGLLRQAIQLDAEEHVRLQQQQQGSQVASKQIEKDLQQEQLQLQKLQQDDQAAYQKQAAGQAAVDALSENYRTVRSDYMDLLHQMDVERQKLMALKGSR